MLFAGKKTVNGNKWSDEASECFFLLGSVFLPVGLY